MIAGSRVLLWGVSEGEGSFDDGAGDGRGTVESSLTSVYPYARFGLGDGVDIWGLVGVGSGDLKLTVGEGGVPDRPFDADGCARPAGRGCAADEAGRHRACGEGGFDVGADGVRCGAVEHWGQP